MSHWLVYWVLMLDNISDTFCIALTLSIGAFVIVGIIHAFLLADPDAPYSVGYAERTKIKNESRIKIGKSFVKWTKYMFPLIIVSAVFACLIPSTKQMAAIYLIPKIASNKSIKQLPPKLSKLALEYVNKELNLESEK